MSTSSYESDGENGEKMEEEQTVEEPKVEELSEEEKEWRRLARDRRDYQEMIQAGLDEPVVYLLIKMFEAGWIKYDEIDDKMKTGLCSLTPKQGVQFLKVMWQRDISHVTNKCAYFLGQMKVFNYYIKRKETIFNGPDPKKIEELQQMTGYSIEVTTGQRRYGGPPPGWEGSPPDHREISVSKVPNDWYEDKLVPLLSQFGKIYELRIMIDNITGWTRNFCFVKYCDNDDNDNALKKIDGYNFEDKKTLKANFSSSNKRLYVGNIPKDKSSEDIDGILSQHVPEITDVEVFVSDELSMRGMKNRGFCFVEFTDHRAAAIGKKILAGLGIKIFNKEKLRVEWFEHQTPCSEQELSKTKTIHVNNISSEVKEDLLTKTFENYGKVVLVQKVRDYAFIHMGDREGAEKAIDALNGAELAGLIIKCTFSESGALKRKIKKKADARRLRGEFKVKKPPPKPKRVFDGRGEDGQGVVVEVGLEGDTVVGTEEDMGEGGMVVMTLVMGAMEVIMVLVGVGLGEGVLGEVMEAEVVMEWVGTGVVGVMEEADMVAVMEEATVDMVARGSGMMAMGVAITSIKSTDLSTELTIEIGGNKMTNMSWSTCNDLFVYNMSRCTKITFDNLEQSLLQTCFKSLHKEEGCLYRTL